MILLRPLAAAATLLALAACGTSGEDEAVPVPEDGVTAEAPAIATQAENETIDADQEADGDVVPTGTPLAERVATLGLLNKRNNLTVEFELKPGEETVIDDVMVKLASCERRPPWDPEPETGAFVQVAVRDAGQDSNAQFKRIFSGWLFLNSPSLNVVEHPVYDVWVKDCAMSFPGEEAAPSE
ncbi:DUF2155 domain-containing protein [Croceicoccus sp. Ery5]|uniref:DUF2155 domain-containing protein n=1 Tax=Croceicoccus sp. Ery5 TaxID=1703340 RepID=UPI001E2ACB10|nr:DUF2155 domain-containing protein [Croceicoccus sp. Ery5]